MTVTHSRNAIFALAAAGLCASLAAAPALAESAKHWGYDGAEGPEHWSELDADFATCGSGDQQSPVNLAGAVHADVDEIGDVDLHWKPAALKVVNNGHSIQAQGPDMGYAMIDGKRYNLLQFHFHSPSEHTEHGVRFPMEAHFVHQADDGTLAVIGVMMVGGGENELFDHIMATAPKEPGAADLGEADGQSLLPQIRGAFHYQGSLTTPPCSEIVTWTVMKEPVAVADDAIAAFRELYSGNARPIQSINRRYILD